MSKLTALLILSSISASFGACASSDDETPDTPSSFCERWAVAACSDDVVSACQAADDRDCQASQRRFCLDQLPAGEFSGARSAQCIDAVEAAYADADISVDEIFTVLRLAAPCDRLVGGLRREGETCADRLDCDSPEGFDCVFKDGQNTGTCQLPQSVGAGQDCSAANAVCGPGFYCNGDNCIAGERPGEACTSHEQCGSTGFCGLTSVCEPRLTVNSPCGFDEQCATGLCYSFSPTMQVCTDRIRLSRSEPMCADLR
jgi:hypothetical protein